MQKVRQGPGVADCAIQQLLGITQALGGLGRVLCQQVKIYFGCGQKLTEAVVQFSRDAAALLVLHAKQMRGKAAKRSGALFHE